MRMLLDSDGALVITAVIRPDFFDPTIPLDEDIMEVAAVAVKLGYPHKWRHRSGHAMGEVQYTFYRE